MEYIRVWKLPKWPVFLQVFQFVFHLFLLEQHNLPITEVASFPVSCASKLGGLGTRLSLRDLN